MYVCDYIILNRVPWKYKDDNQNILKHFRSPVNYFDYWAKWILRWEKFIIHNQTIEKNYVQKNLLINFETYKINVPKNGSNHWLWFIWNFFIINMEKNRSFFDNIYFQLSKAFLIISRHNFSWSKAKIRLFFIKYILEIIYDNKEIYFKKNISPLVIFTQMNINLIYTSFIPDNFQGANIEQFNKIKQKGNKNKEQSKKIKEINYKNSIQEITMKNIDKILIENSKKPEKRTIKDYFHQ